MYNEDEKQQLMNDLVEMETFQADTGDEGKILQDDLKKYFINGEGDRQDLIFRIELYFYAFKLFCRKEAKIDSAIFCTDLTTFTGSLRSSFVIAKYGLSVSVKT